MKMRMILLLLLSVIPVAAANAAQRPAPSNDVSARIFNSADISVPQSQPGEWQTLTFDSVRWDTNELREGAKNPNRLKAPAAGKYYIFANITWESPISSGVWGLRLRLNGKTVIAEQSVPNNGAPFRISMSVGTLYALAAGDYVDVQVFQSSGGSVFIRHAAATSPEFGMAKIP